MRIDRGQVRIPKNGLLDFFFIDSISLAPLPRPVPVVKFKLDVSKVGDRSVLQLLIRRSRTEPGDNITKGIYDSVSRVSEYTRDCLELLHTNLFGTHMTAHQRSHSRMKARKNMRFGSSHCGAVW